MPRRQHPRLPAPLSAHRHNRHRLRPIGCARRGGDGRIRGHAAAPAPVDPAATASRKPFCGAAWAAVRPTACTWSASGLGRGQRGGGNVPARTQAIGSGSLMRSSEGAASKRPLWQQDCAWEKEGLHIMGGEQVEQHQEGILRGKGLSAQGVTQRDAMTNTQHSCASTITPKHKLQENPISDMWMTRKGAWPRRSGN